MAFKSWLASSQSLIEKFPGQNRFTAHWLTPLLFTTVGSHSFSALSSLCWATYHALNVPVWCLRNKGSFTRGQFLVRNDEGFSVQNDDLKWWCVFSIREKVFLCTLRASLVLPKCYQNVSVSISKYSKQKPNTQKYGLILSIFVHFRQCLQIRMIGDRL